MKLKSILLAVIVSIPLLLTSCGDKQPQQKHLEYENAVATFVGAFNKEDEQSLLSCFTPAARDEFLLTDQSAVSLLDENISDTFGDHISLSYTLNDKTELTEEEIDELKNEYKSSYGMRLNIKKAYYLDVTFSVSGVAKKSESADMVIVTAKTDDGWCIYGEVITSIF